ncbi:uncharacterized protein METZ01_LOCUS190140 [marine metagenome]|uniref:Uncharacterized protein n=1 Tax=marine metagenome TaxID=408172 RepID=A0A382DFL9_9ZZZZ
MGVRLESEVKSNRRDLDHLKSELDRRDTYVETVKQRAEIDIHGKQISTLWDFVNKLRDKLNGGSL